MNLRLLIFSLLSLLLGSNSYAAQSDTLEVNTLQVGYAQYAPYSYDSPTGAAGIEVDILKIIFERLNINASHQVLPWMRVQANVEKGLLDAYVAVGTPKRLEYSIASKKPVISANIAAFYHSDNTTESRYRGIAEVTDLENFIIGGLNGNGWIKKNLPHADIRKVVSMRALAKMLLRKRVDVVPENVHIFRYYLAQIDTEKKIIFNVLDAPKIQLHILFSKKSPFLKRLPEIDAVLEEMINSGEIDKIYANYR